MAAAATRRPKGPPERYNNLNQLALKFNVGSFGCEMLYWGYLAHKWWRNYMHVHTFYEICYCFEGTGTFEMLGKVYTIKPGEVFIAKPREEHEIISSRKNVLGIYFWAYTLVPPTSALRTSEEPTDRLLHEFIGSNCWVSKRTTGMLPTLRLICDEIGRVQPGYVNLIEGLTRKLVVDTARSVCDGAMPAEQPLPRVDNPDRLIVERAVRYMRDNQARTLAVSEVAEQVSLSERHLNRLFHKHLKKSPLEFLTQIRIEAAAQLLLDKSLPIKDIAARVGYPDVRYFTTVFRQFTRLTPAVYRKRGGTSWVEPGRVDNRP